MIFRFSDKDVRPCNIDRRFIPLCPIKEPAHRSLWKNGIVGQNPIHDLFLGIRANTCDISVTIRVLDKYDYTIHASRGEFTHAFYGKPIILASLDEGDVRVTGSVHDCYFIFGYTADFMNLLGTSILYTLPDRTKVTFHKNILRFMDVQYLTEEGAARILQQRLFRKWLLWKEGRFFSDDLNRVIASFI